MTEETQYESTFGASMLEHDDAPPQNLSANPTMGELIGLRFSRRGLLKGALAVSAISATVGAAALATAEEARAQAKGSAFSFKEVEAGVDADHHVAEGYQADVLLRWGDPIVAGAPEFDPAKQTAEAQSRQFGYNNDFVGYTPMPGAADPSAHGLLFVNHEYTNPHLMFPGVVEMKDGKPVMKNATKERFEIEAMAHGATVAEIRKTDGKWALVKDSKYNRRITVATEMQLSGPVAGSDRVKTNADASGKKVFGTINNCAGALTPWGTFVTGEENVHGYFSGKLPDGHREEANYKRMAIPSAPYAWGRFEERFDLAKDPNEANRFGWIVEVDPLDPNSVPKKRTALGRFKHEGADNIVAKNGQVAVYLGDDERFDYVYKFVTAGRFDPNNRAANMDLFDAGTLYVARFDADGGVAWLPLLFGQGPLTAANGFQSQADVLIETRRAGDLLGATKMDRPEDITPNPVTGRVYVMLTNNTNRTDAQVDAANPRAKNAFGHIVEIIEDGGDHTATKGKWEILLKCGDPSVAAVGATFSTETSKNGWFGMPDNAVVDSAGRLWISTDGNGFPETGRTDGLWAVDTEGEARRTSKLFYRVPHGAELCGPCFTPDDTTAFVAVQHPGDDGPDWPAFGRRSYYEDLSTRWPDFKPDMPVRPSVVAITKKGGGKIGV
ncbi:MULTISPECIES: PhoX family phosphatase [unclassified Bosea (in: a-proteobacteria)]|uniref:PhoX family protein n=1 Tax=unclassified Bosea (in: a-proteobacteria) TaxID=2653178 RepID=UPI000F7520D5|nr:MULTISPECIES: PhoX family phosphatase [unclassified Bosea (in: a-proteobacteria)]AZO81093.1 dTDP-glucose 4,6-dehydratase [Bosea sp. Tri-49]RXT26060.1 dTDP-glucose 4,6-dehydratase [Bosea sp. Tri-39]RXT31302.1 dTDP-glucose 4,6-dehydratase [Bosea sp. Tri-54]